MYLYFDNNGILREIVDDISTRQGNAEVNKIYIYLEGYTPKSEWITYENSDGTKSNELVIDTITNKTIPYNKYRDLKFFKDFQEYTFYVATIPSSVLTISGLTKASVRVALQDNSFLTLGLIVFTIEDSVVAIDSEITESQYLYLLSLISDLNQIRTTGVIGIHTEIVDGESAPFDENRIVVSSYNDELTVAKVILNEQGYTIYKILGTSLVKPITDYIDNNEYPFLQGLQIGQNFYRFIPAGVSNFRYSIAIGEESNAVLPSNIAIGYQSNANKTRGVAIGAFSKNEANRGVAIGSSSINNQAQENGVSFDGIETYEDGEEKQRPVNRTLYLRDLAHLVFRNEDSHSGNYTYFAKQSLEDILDKRNFYSTSLSKEEFLEEVLTPNIKNGVYISKTQYDKIFVRNPENEEELVANNIYLEVGTSYPIFYQGQSFININNVSETGFYNVWLNPHGNSTWENNYYHLEKLEQGQEKKATRSVEEKPLSNIWGIRGKIASIPTLDWDNVPQMLYELDTNLVGYLGLELTLPDSFKIYNRDEKTYYPEEGSLTGYNKGYYDIYFHTDTKEIVVQPSQLSQYSIGVGVYPYIAIVNLNKITLIDENRVYNYEIQQDGTLLENKLYIADFRYSGGSSDAELYDVIYNTGEIQHYVISSINGIPIFHRGQTPRGINIQILPNEEDNSINLDIGFGGSEHTTLPLATVGGQKLVNGGNIPLPTKLSDLTNDSGFITNTVNNLTNYYLKTETYSQSEIDRKINDILNGTIQVVDDLPEVGQAGVIYLVPSGSNNYERYVWENGQYIDLGSTNIDLSNYLTKTDAQNTYQKIISSYINNLSILANGFSFSTVLNNGTPTTTTKYLGLSYSSTSKTLTASNVDASGSNSVNMETVIEDIFSITDVAIPNE